MSRGEDRRPISQRRRRIEYCASVAVGAIILAVTTAGAQSYNATPTVLAGDINYNQSPGITDVTLNATAAVIRWDVPAGTGTYDFQSAGTTATFHLNTDFSVLNIVAIDPSRAIKFNGATNSRIDAFPTNLPGGNIWFYSPGGIIVGATASFNVGSLLLTTSTPFDQSAGFDNGTVSLSGTPNSASAIIVEAGASITANNYIAMVAPRIEQGGTVRAGGEIAYVAAESADIVFPAGSSLFSIDIPTGSDATNGQGQVLVHTGTTGGPGAGANTPNRNIYFVAMPKNTAITSLLGGSIGYDAASGAAVNSEGIYLLGGGVVINGQPYLNGDASPLPGLLDETPTTISIPGGASFLQDVTAYATNIAMRAVTGDISFARNAALHATLNNSLDVGTGQQLAAGGNLSLYAQGRDANDSLIGGDVSVTVTGGTLQAGASTIDNTALLLTAEGIGAAESGATGGSVTLSVNGGSVSAGVGGVTLNANGTGGAGSATQGGDGVGGTATLSLQGSLATGGAVTLSANGVGGDSERNTAGAGTAGAASVVASAGGALPTSILTTNAIAISADGTGGRGQCISCTAVGARGGAGSAGAATLVTTDTNVTAPTITASATGIGGDGDAGTYPDAGAPGDNGSGGLAKIEFTRGAITSSTIVAQADGTGGFGGASFEGTSGSVTTSADGGRGGTGTAGRAEDGKGASVRIAGATLLAGEGRSVISINARGTGGDGGISADTAGGDGGAGIGGDAAFVQALAANVTADLDIDTSAHAGNGGASFLAAHSTGGDATAGSAIFTATGGGTFGGNITLIALADGGLGGAASDDLFGFHGLMRGGHADTVISGTSVALTNYLVDLTAVPPIEVPDQYRAGAATGGSASITVAESGMLNASAQLKIDSSAGDVGGSQAGADATGGAITIRALSGGSITSTSTSLTSEGFGGASTAGAAGNGFGAAMLIEADGATIGLGTATANSSAGGGASTTNGGNGRGGSITINAKNGGTFGASGGLTLDVRGYTYSDGGTAAGGSISLASDGGQFTVGDLNARAIGDLQNNLGTSTGGTISISATGSPSLSRPSTFGNAIFDVAGDTTAGTILLSNNVAGGASPMSFGSLSAFANGPSAGTAIAIASNGSAISASSALIDADGGVAVSALNGGTFSAAGNLTVNGASFISVDGGGSATPSIQGANLLFTTAAFDAVGSTILSAATDLEINASGHATAHTLNAGNRVYVHTPGTSSIGGAVNAAVLDVRGGTGVALGGTTPATITVSGTASFDAGSGSLNGLGTVAVNAAAITINTANDIVAPGVSLRASGDIALNISRDLIIGDLIAGGRLLPAPLAFRRVSVGGQISVGVGGLDLASAGAMSVDRIVLGDTSPITLTAGGSLNFGTLGGGSATLTANGGDLVGGTLTVAGTATLRASGGVRLNGAMSTGRASFPTGSAAVQGANDSLGNGGDLVINANGDIAVANAAVGGRALLTGGGAVSISTLRSGGDLRIVAPGTIGFASLAGNAVTVTSTGGAVSGQSLAAGYTMTLSAATSLQVAGLSSADVVTATGRTVSLSAPNALTLASLTSGGAAQVDAGSLSITGQVLGTTIDLGSQTITIGPAARIGTAGTTTAVTFRNTGTGRSFVGAAGNGYSLASSGLARVQADLITLALPQTSASSAAQPDVVIGDLTLHGSTGTATGTLANLTSTGSFVVQTPGRVQVAGKVQLSDLAAGNSATISAGQAIEVVTPSGQIVLSDSAGGAQGSLTLTAPKVSVASALALADLSSLTNYDARETRLARNDGAAADNGYLTAAHLTFRVADLLNIQNSGASSTPVDRRGLNAGSGGIDVVATATRLPEIIINGRQAVTGGGFVTGFDLKPLVRTANATGPVNANSVLSVNGCTPTRCSLSPIGDAFTYVPTVVPPQDLEGLLSTDEKTAQILPVLVQPLIALPVTTPFSFAPVVDEPVTGMGVEAASMGSGPEDGSGTGSAGVAGNTGGSVGNGTQNSNVGTGNDDGIVNVGTGNDSGNVGPGPQNAGVGTGPENGNGPSGNSPPAGPGSGQGTIGSGRNDDRPQTPGG